MRDEVLVESLPGLQVCGRDKDRGWSRKRVDALINEISEWRECVVMLSKQIAAKLFRVSTCMKLLQECNIDACRGGANDYGSMGLIRCLGIVFESNLIDDEIEWAWLRRCSTGVTARLRSLGLYEYVDAERCRRCLQASLKLSQYSLSDLVVFVCLLGRVRLP